ncbi:MAG: hypothetical protein LBI18_09595 [Planctomycetaceae bacterium]|nr:hypothetical protein [Planctomycetaceae bacterium]
MDSIPQKSRDQIRLSALKTIELTRKFGCVTSEVVQAIESLTENGFIRDTLEAIRRFPPSYERSNSFCYITFCKSEHFDCLPKEVAEVAVEIAESGFAMFDDELPPEKCDRYFALYVTNVSILINEFAEHRGLENAKVYLDRLKKLVERLDDPMDRILSLRAMAWGYCRNGNYDVAETLIDEAGILVKQAPPNFWNEWNSYQDNPLTYENVCSWVDAVKNTIAISKSNMITIEKIVKGSAETELQEFSLHNNCLTVKARLPYYGDANYGINGNLPYEEITVMLKIRAEVFDVRISDTMPLSAQFRLDCLEGIKANTWGYYIPSDNKDEFFWSIKNGFALAFGRHFQKYRWLFRIIFAEGHVHILLADPNEIEFTVEETI